MSWIECGEVFSYILSRSASRGGESFELSQKCYQKHPLLTLFIAISLTPPKPMTTRFYRYHAQSTQTHDHTITVKRRHCCRPVLVLKGPRSVEAGSAVRRRIPTGPGTVPLENSEAVLEQSCGRAVGKLRSGLRLGWLVVQGALGQRSQHQAFSGMSGAARAAFARLRESAGDLCSRTHGKSMACRARNYPEVGSSSVSAMANPASRP